MLSRLGLFSGSSHAIRERLAAIVEPRELAPGETLLREGDPADALWVLAKGTLAVSSSAVADGSIPDVVAPDVVGEIGVLRGIPRTATVAAKTPAEVWRLSADEYLQAVEPQRLPLLLLGPSMTRLNRTHPHLAVAAPAGG
jgi:CRP-like cAMP-binding protein